MEKRSIGVISLIGGDQADLIRSLLNERIGAELIQRHRILCGDSATFQGNERDIVFLSMVADRSRKQALTMRRYEQRFNVAVSRARDRLVLVRSVVREELNPQDLKARLLAHFEEPMPLGRQPTGGDPMELCESQFERDVMGRLLALGYRVEPQVGALGFRIDIVVEGEGGRRLAVECDGDRFHGPAVWRDDMRRQRVLERVGWVFWRCFASSFYRDPDGTIADLVQTLTRFGIAPMPEGGEARPPSPFVERRVAAPPAVVAEPKPSDQAELDLSNLPEAPAARPSPHGAGVGDRVVLTFADGRKPLALLLTDGPEDASSGLVALASPLGQALAGREEDEELDLPLGSESVKALVERIEARAA
jgi:very-short-patch-repair endonuclease